MFNFAQHWMNILWLMFQTVRKEHVSQNLLTCSTDCVLFTSTWGLWSVDSYCVCVCVHLPHIISFCRNNTAHDARWPLNYNYVHNNNNNKTVIMMMLLLSVCESRLVSTCSSAAALILLLTCLWFKILSLWFISISFFLFSFPDHLFDSCLPLSVLVFNLLLSETWQMIILGSLSPYWLISSC